MKSALTNIIISLILAVGGVISLLFNLMGGKDWIWDWVGLLLAYISLSILIGLYNKTVDHKTLPRIVKRILFISFNVTVLGIIIGITCQLLEKANLTIMMYYWLIMLLLHFITIITLVILVFVHLNSQNYSLLYTFIVILNIFLTLGPVLYPLVLTIIGNGMNASAGWQQDLNSIKNENGINTNWYFNIKNQFGTHVEYGNKFERRIIE